MPAFDPDTLSLDSLRERQSAKYQVYDSDVLPAWVAEMDFPLAAPISEALHAAVDRSDTGYHWRGVVAEVFADYARRSWGWEVEPNRVMLVPDVLVGIEQAINALTDPSDGVVITPPVYHPFFSVVRDICRRVLVEVPMAAGPDGTYDWDLDALEEAFARPDVTAFVMANPHNPTGTVATRATLARIAEIAAANGVVVIADEIHAPLALPGAVHVPYLTVVDDDALAVVVTSSSKAWNTPGLKCAQVVPTRAAGATLRASMPIEVTYGTGNLGVIAAIAAYRDGGAWLDQVVGVLDTNRRLLADLLSEFAPAVRYRAPEASYLAWLDMRDCDLGDDPSAVLLDRGRVALSPGPAFGRPGSGFARLNFATSPTILTEAVRRIAGALEIGGSGPA